MCTSEASEAPALIPPNDRTDPAGEAESDNESDAYGEIGGKDDTGVTVSGEMCKGDGGPELVDEKADETGEDGDSGETLPVVPKVGFLRRLLPHQCLDVGDA